MTDTFKPSDTKQLTEIIAWAAAEESPLDVIGSGSKNALGRPLEGARVLDLSALSGVLFYEPEELVLSVRAATGLDQVRDLLKQRNQMLAFEPPDWGWLLSGESNAGTIGGMVATGLSGPRRFKAGAVRDHVLGATAVSGRGEVFVSGGRVVKNVTGYDLPKLLTGSWGTLAAISDLNLKVLPAPEKTYTLLIYGLNAPQAVAAMTKAAQSPYEVSGLAYLPADLASQSAVSYVATGGATVTAIRVEGLGVSVKHRMESLRVLLSESVSMDELHSSNSDAFWAEVRDVRLMPEDCAAVWRVSVPPGDAPEFLSAIDADAHFLDAGGGLVWLGFASTEVGQGQRIRHAIKTGHTTLMRAPENIRGTESVFQPQPAPLAALTNRVKESFDPKHILNPGRMVEGV